ncbi:hypothetical protein K505DRAFT_332604 [Melanomma pulvis-pyrius CBS 109.77]|uniref:Uncharacterized protein n=1 Tax=Melanomma pulvis-pyrius CBS 109.77 TaxID=1314802 RepID=A0A6A6XUY1_9PLEO|nr:hypothetical protein K505DRAFT_332604 [Melanomma pulvis-pyrius CBS 109.77]
MVGDAWRALMKTFGVKCSHSPPTPLSPTPALAVSTPTLAPDRDDSRCERRHCCAPLPALSAVARSAVLLRIAALRQDSTSALRQASHCPRIGHLGLARSSVPYRDVAGSGSATALVATALVATVDAALAAALPLRERTSPVGSRPGLVTHALELLLHI